jgi:hypothetical protein
MQTAELAACAELAVTMEPAPTTAALTPARLSSDLRETLELAMLRTSVSVLRCFRLWLG